MDCTIVPVRVMGLDVGDNAGVSGRVVGFVLHPKRKKETSKQRHMLRIKKANFLLMAIV